MYAGLKIFVLIAAFKVADAACPIHTVNSTSIQQCLSAFGYLNTSIHSHDEMCSMYQESMYCAKRGLDAIGLNCSLPDIAASLSIFYNGILSPKVDFTSCQLPPEASSLCASPERLSMISLIGCQPYVSQMSSVGNIAAACVYSDYLLQCASLVVGFSGVTCSDSEIRTALGSHSAAVFYHRHSNGKDFSQCFQTTSVSMDNTCDNYMNIFANPHAIYCISSLPNINFTNNSFDENVKCSFVQEVEACMVRQLQQSGSHCTMTQMKSAIITYNQLSPNPLSGIDLITKCLVNDNYATMPVCSDSFRFTSLILMTVNTLFQSFETLPKELVCSSLANYATTVTKYLDVTCTSAELFAALTSTFASSVLSTRYPNLSLNHCLSTLSSGPQFRQKRNAVAVKDWLWRDKKIPYVIEESDFSTDGVLMIIKAIKQFNQDISCVKFTPRINEFDYIRFRSGQGCHSSIGRDGGEQTLTIGPECYYLGVIMHEMTHAVGFFHEQNRWDRDDYVTILWNNIESGKEHDFSIQDKRYLDTLGAPYDYGSIMHYGPYIFSKDPNKPTMSPKYEPHIELGQRDGFSKLDIWKINTLYGCEKGPAPLPEWMSYLSSTWRPVTQTTTTAATSSASSSTTQIPGKPGKPKVLVTVFPNALRINWDQPPSDYEITTYIVTYKLEPNGELRQVHVSANKLAYYLPTYSYHPGRRYTVMVSAFSDNGFGPDSDPVTTRTACSQTVYLDNESYDKIHSPFFKNGYYEQDVVCQWTIKAPPRQHINLTFTALDIAGDSNCSGDFVKVGDTRLYCSDLSSVNPTLIMASKEVSVTFVSKPGSNETKQGGFSMVASAQGYSPMNLNIEELNTAFNVSWETPLQLPAPVTAYVISYRLTSESSATEITVSPNTHYFLLSTYPHYGREYSIEVYAKYPSGIGEPAGPLLQRSKCSRNITVFGTGEHLNSPHYPNPYEPGTICEWNVIPTSGHKLNLTFESVNLNSGDYVDILSEGTYMRIDGNNLPNNTLIATSARVQFVSDDADEASGFRINFSLT